MINKHAIDHFFKPSPFSSAAKRTDWTLLLLSLQIKNSICKSASKKLNSCRELTYVLKIMPQKGSKTYSAVTRKSWKLHPILDPH